MEGAPFLAYGPICVDGLYELQIYLFIYYILLRILGWGVYS